MEESGEKQKKWVEMRDELAREQKENKDKGSHRCPADPGAKPVEFCNLKIVVC